MPNQCTKCGKMHADDADYILTRGCDACGGRFFFFVRGGLAPEAGKELSNISKKELNEMERDIREIAPVKKAHKKDDTVILDIEAIRVIKPGKYSINVKNLLEQRPIVVRVGTGKYELDLSSIAKLKEKENEKAIQT